MATVYLGVGSNVDAESNIRRALSALRDLYGDVQVSPVYRNAAYGFDGDEFLNLVVALRTDEAPARLLERIEAIHARAGRLRGSDRFVARALDIDLLLYDGRVDRRARLPRTDVLEHSFVLRPLADIAPDAVHPETGRTFAEHWREFDATRHPLTPVAVIL